jgi:hypothetical protein
MAFKATTCSIESCDARVYSRNLCRDHYKTLKESRQCKSEGCTARVSLGGLCSEHYGGVND